MYACRFGVWSVFGAGLAVLRVGMWVSVLGLVWFTLVLWFLGLRDCGLCLVLLGGFHWRVVWV